MKRKLTVLILLLFVLSGCSDATSTPSPSVPTAQTNNINPTPTGAIPAPTKVAAATQAPATAEAGSPTEAISAPTEVAEATEAPSTGAPNSAIPQSVDLKGSAAATIADTSGYYRLQTVLSEGNSGCLEGNQLADGAVLGGAAFIDNCQNVTGQLWKLTPAEQQGYYHLQTRFLEGQNKCLEGNQVSDGAAHDGAAFMDDCSGAVGRSWKFVDAGGGTYRLQTQLLVDQNKCLEGNQLADRAVLGGASYMDDCKSVTGQVWKLVPATDAATAADRHLVDVPVSTGAVIQDTSVYYHLQTVESEKASKCLEGNNLGDTAVLKGASFMDKCQEVTGQMWNIIPTEYPDYYKLQTKGLEEQFKCLEANTMGAGATLNGAAFMDDCTYSTGQYWKFVDAGNGTYRMQAMSLQAQNKCLLGNNVGDTALLGGASYMDTCQSVEGQLWKLVPIPGSSTATGTGTPMRK